MLFALNFKRARVHRALLAACNKKPMGLPGSLSKLAFMPGLEAASGMFL
jgi:hypothetical protein